MDRPGTNGVAPGRVIGRRYEILRPLRWEPHGTVYLVRDQILEAEVGLKFLPNEAPDFDRYLDCYRREAILGLKLRHPQILGVLQLDETTEGIFLIQEPCQGNSLAEFLSHSNLLTQDDAVYLLEVLAQGLSFAHKQGFSHQYLHPGQILISATEGIKITNFAFPPDLAVVRLDPEAAAYLPPEIWEGEESTPAGNIFSLGVIAYRMLTGHLPYPPAAEVGLPYALTPELQGLEFLSQTWQGLLRSCLAANPSDRLPSALEFLKELHCLYPKTVSQGWQERPADTGNETTSRLGSSKGHLREPEVAIDPLWERVKRPSWSTWWSRGADWFREQSQRAKALLGSESLRHNRRKQLAAAGSGLVILLVGTYFLGRLLLAPHPTPEAQLTAATNQQPPLLQAAPEHKTSEAPATISDRPQAPAPAAAEITEASRVPVQAPPQAPALRPTTPARAAVAPKKEVKRLAAKPESQTTAKQAPVPRVVGSYSTVAQARHQAGLLKKQGKKVVIRKVAQGRRPLYQVVMVAATSPSQAQALARSRSGSRYGPASGR